MESGVVAAPLTVRVTEDAGAAGSCAAAVVFEAILARPSRGPSRLERSGGGPSRPRPWLP